LGKFWKGIAKMSLRLSDFEYFLPKELIAQRPTERRDESKLLILNRKEKSLKETVFKDIVNFIQEEDILVLNNTKVIPAKFLAKRKTGAKLEILFLRERERNLWETLIRPSKRVKLGESIIFGGDGRFEGEILERTEDGKFLIRFDLVDIKEIMAIYGEIPLPPYIKEELTDPDRYQTVFSEREGAIASPTAGLHFTKELLKDLSSRGIKILYLTLHCGLATFSTVKTEDIRTLKLGAEFCEISKDSASKINQAKKENRRIIAVGTTVVRTLESTAFVDREGVSQIRPYTGEINLYIYPSYRFKIVDSLITNFHLPCSTNLILVSAFSETDFVLRAYQYAIEKKFRFYSFGDAMFII